MVMFQGWLAWVLVLFLSLASRVIMSASYSSASVNVPVSVPAAIAVPAAGYKLQVAVFAKGYQYYRFNGSSWVNYNASAVLYQMKPKVKKLAAIGRHFYLTQPDALGGEPTWETLPKYGVPFSLVTGVAAARVTVDPNSIAWVLLNATNSEGDRGTLVTWLTYSAITLPTVLGQVPLQVQVWAKSRDRDIPQTMHSMCLRDSHNK